MGDKCTIGRMVMLRDVTLSQYHLLDKFGVICEPPSFFFHIVSALQLTLLPSLPSILSPAFLYPVIPSSTIPSKRPLRSSRAASSCRHVDGTGARKQEVEVKQERNTNGSFEWTVEGRRGRRTRRWIDSVWSCSGYVMMSRNVADSGM